MNQQKIPLEVYEITQFIIRHDNKINMPLNKKGKKIMTAMKKEYGAKKGEKVFYASKNKGSIKAVEKKKKR